MHKKWQQRCCAWLLAGAMVMTGAPSLSLSAQGLEAVEQEEASQALAAVQEEKAADAEMGGYLWLNFGDQEGGYEKIFYGYSEDGLTWKKLNKVNGTVRSVLSNHAKGSDLGVRDPHLIRSAKGDKYWILGTDLHAEGGGTGGSGWNQLSASQNLIIWESTDLVNWSEPRLVYAGFDNAGCVWAPEAIYDEATGDYVVYWSARDKSKAGTDQNALRVYVCRTKDFVTFTEPKVWLSEDQDTGGEVNIIDSTIVKDNGKFYRFSTSDWNTVVDVSNTLDTEDVLDIRNGETSKPKGSWTRLVTRSESAAAGFTFINSKGENAGIEGLTVYQLPDGRWCAMGDNQGYKAYVTDDLSSGKFTAANASFPDGKFRHGTVVRLTKEEDARVQAAFGDRTTEQETSSNEPVLSYDFEGDVGKRTITDSATGNNTKDNGILWGNAEVVYDEERESNVLKLDGSDHAYAEIPIGFFDKRDTMTISMDVKTQNSDSDAIFTFAFGKSKDKYDFLRVRGTQVRNAITVSSYNSEKEVKGSGASAGQWQKVTIVIDGTNMKLYIDGKLVSENNNTGIRITDLGTDLLAYLGKSFYDPDGYFNGSYDNFKVYNRVLSETEVYVEAMETASFVKGGVVGSVPENPLELRGTDNHTAVFSTMKGKNLVSYVRTGTDLTAVPVQLRLFDEDVQVTIGGTPFTGGILDLSKDVEVKAAFVGQTQTYTIKKPQIAHNPVLPGQYADPDIDYFDGKFWIYPTTDGYPGWSGTVFHAFSSPDMVNWEDEGIIMELKNQNPGPNDNNVQIANSPWAVNGSAWAPTIEKKNGKYYFYYCGKLSNGQSAIGVAEADDPAGPYTDLGDPLMTVAMCQKAGVSMGQAIDPSIFTDDDGTSYILFGNGEAAIAQLDETMMGIVDGTLKQINGLKIKDVVDFRESVIVTKANGKYHWTWSDDDANSPNYHVNYGVSDKLIQDDGTVNVTFKKANLLSKDESKQILGSAHQSVLHVKDANGKDRYFMAYHRFYTPTGIFTKDDGLGVHRETCIDEIFFDENDEMVITPTLEGVSAVEPAIDLEPTVAEKESGSFEVTLPKVEPAKETAVTVELPASLAYSIEKSQAKQISINVEAPKSDKAVLSTITVSKEILEAAKTTGKDLTVTVNGSNPYQWTFSAETLASAQLTKLDLALDIDNAKDAEAKKLLNTDEEGMELSFAQHGELPGAKVTVDAAKMKWKAGETVTLSYYNSKTKTLEKIQDYTVGSNGKVTIDVAKGGKYVLWKKVKVTGVTLNKTTLSLQVGKTATLTATVSPANAVDKKVTWKSDNEKVAVVDKNNGKVTAKAKGTANITATAANGVSATCKVTVTGVSVKTVAISKKLTLGAGEKYTMKAKISPSDATNQKVTWDSSNKKAATISTKGVIEAKKVKKATTTKITAKVDGKTSKACMVTVKPAPKKISLNAKAKTLKKGKTFQIKVKLPKNTASNKITYSSNKKKVASVSATGKVKALKKGKAVITVKSFNNKKAKITITVK